MLSLKQYEIFTWSSLRCSLESNQHAFLVDFTNQFQNVEFNVAVISVQLNILVMRLLRKLRSRLRVVVTSPTRRNGVTISYWYLDSETPKKFSADHQNISLKNAKYFKYTLRNSKLKHWAIMFCHFKLYHYLKYKS